MGMGEGRSTWGREIRFCRSYVICKYWVQLKTLGTQLEYIIGWLRKLTPRLNIHISSSGGVQGVGGGGGGDFSRGSGDIINQRSKDFDKCI